MHKENWNVCLLFRYLNTFWVTSAIPTTFQYFLEFLSVWISVWIHIKQKLMNRISPNRVYWKGKLLYCVLHFVALRCDKRELRSSDKSVRSTSCCSEFASFLLIRLTFFTLIPNITSQFPIKSILQFPLISWSLIYSYSSLQRFNSWHLRFGKTFNSKFNSTRTLWHSLIHASKPAGET